MEGGGGGERGQLLLASLLTPRQGQQHGGTRPGGTERRPSALPATLAAITETTGSGFLFKSFCLKL